MKDFMKISPKWYLDIAIGLVINLIWVVIVLVFKPIVGMKISLSVSILLILIFVILTLMILYYRRIKSTKAIMAELENLKNPANNKVNEFNLGDQVIRKIDEKMIIPKPLSVYKVDLNKVHCRNEKNEITDYAPDELYTAVETKRIIDIKEAEIRRLEEENRSAMVDFTRW